MYYAWGMCIHPECKASHDREYRGILERYQMEAREFRSKIYKVNANDLMPTDTSIKAVVRDWKNKLRELIRGSKLITREDLTVADYTRKMYMMTEGYTRDVEYEDGRIMKM